MKNRRARPTNFPKIFAGRVFDLARRCDAQQCAHISKAIEVADRGSGHRGSSDSLVRGSNRLPSGITEHITRSIGNPILDNSTVSALRRWRFKPGTPQRVRIPITFVLTGAQY